ncbi:MAG: adenylate/guanylate cyclase domain-containing protein [Chthoniobacterales bacterium]
MKAQQDSVFDEALHQEMNRREARSEQWSCLIMAGVLFTLFLIIRFAVQGLTGQQIADFRWIGLSTIISLLLLAGIIQLWRWVPVMKFINTALQVSTISMMLLITTREHGPEFAMTTAAPMLYALVISVTAFRLSASLSLFAGILSALEFLAVYTFIMRPMLTPEEVLSMPTLGYPAMIVRIIILLAIGFTCMLAARALSSHVVRSVKDAVKVDLLERTFGRYVSPEIAKHVLSNDRFMEARKLEGVVMFADLRGFTSYSENRDPEQIAAMLNRCWDIAMQIVETHGGVVNKFLGDGFMALFGVPIALPNPEAAAAATAVKLQGALQPLLEPEGLSLCIGIHQGEFIAGGIGSESRCEFTVIGTTVNVASRIESLNRELKTNCLASTALINRIGESFDIRSQGKRSVKGIHEPMEVHEVGEKSSDLPLI